MSVSRRLRYEILRRDDHACRYCGQRAPDVQLTVDHVVPVALGGSDEPTNLVTACRDCNAGKTSVAPDSPIVANVADDALRWAQAMAFAADIQAEDWNRRDNYVATFDAAWTTWHRTSDGSLIERPPMWKGSIAGFYAQSLELEELIGFIETAMHRGTRGEHPEFRYLCGMAWGVLRDRQEMARDILAKRESDGA